MMRNCGHAMKYALSTNFNNSRLSSGEAIADEAGEMGFDSLELGFGTTLEQVPGFKRRLDQMPVASVHAYCPVPPGAPNGHPELYKLTSSDENERAIARILLKKTIAFAADMGAKTVVFHAGYVSLRTLFGNLFTKATKLRIKRGPKTYDLFRQSLDAIIPDLEKYGVTLALENLPRLEGFPNVEEAEKLMAELKTAPVKLWFDTGHARVRECRKWSLPATEVAMRLKPHICGMHLNDVESINDDHRQPGWGKVDFAALKPLAVQEGFLRVFEPHEPVTTRELAVSLRYIRELWQA